MPGSRRVKVGVVGVDAGLCWIGDPCYILHPAKMPEAVGKDWGDFCEKLGREQYPTMTQFNYDRGHPGLGVCVSTGYGDGEYPVYATITDGRIRSVTVRFF